jgi:hypothetical protein
MILYRLIFGSFPKAEREAATDVVEHYISVLLNNGQAVGEYVHLLQDGKLCAYLSVPGIYARSWKFHCRYGRARLEEVINYFGSPPQWELLDDEAPKRDRTWAKAPFLSRIWAIGNLLCAGEITESRFHSTAFQVPMKIVQASTTGNVPIGIVTRFGWAAANSRFLHTGSFLCPTANCPRRGGTFAGR